MTGPPAEAGHGLGFERLLFFSDAVFAIAITLLVLDLRPAFTGAGAFTLSPILPNLAGFGLSFYVVGRYWLAHHQLFETISAYDRRLLAVNLAFLASIVFLPFSTVVVTRARAESTPVIFYCVSVAAVGLTMIAVTLAARRPALWRPSETRGGTVKIVAGLAAAPLVFAASAVVAVRSPRLALWLLFLLIPVGWLADALGRVLQRRIDGRTS